MTLFILIGVKDSVVCEGDRDKLRERGRWRQDCYADPLLLLVCVIFMALRLFSCWDVLTQSSLGSCWAPAATFLYLPSRLTTANWDWLRTELHVSHMGICIYNFITPTHFCSTTWFLLLIFTDASCRENLWLTAWSRVICNIFLNGISIFICYLLSKPFLLKNNGSTI